MSKTAIFNQPGERMELVDIQIPDLKEQEILVRVEYTTLCRSDLNTFTGIRQEKTPTILGHEIVGRIIKYGPSPILHDYRNYLLKTGDRITWSIYASEPDSYYAKIGIPQKAAGLFKYGHEKHTADNTLHGGLSEYCILRKNTTIVKVGEQIPAPVIAIINCAVATVAAAIRLAGKLTGQNVIVSGTGMLGVIACAMLKIRNVQHIIALDINPKRLEIAKRFGATYTIVSENENYFQEVHLPGNLKIQTVLEFSGAASAMESTLGMLDIGGLAVWIGATFPQSPLQINAEKIVRNLLTIKGLHNYTADDLVTAVNFIENYYMSFPFEELIFDHFTLNEVNEAFNYALSSEAFRVGLRISK